MPLRSKPLAKLLALAVFTAALMSCGSQEEEDKKTKSPQGTPAPKQKDTGDAVGKRSPVAVGLPRVLPPGGSNCIAPMNIELALDPNSATGTQSYLVARLDQSCYARGRALIRLFVENGVRLSASLACTKLNNSDFNFECVSEPGPFIEGDSIVIPVVINSLGAQSLRAEIEFPAQNSQ